jgi:hypothetical protein
MEVNGAKYTIYGFPDENLRYSENVLSQEHHG